MKEQEVNGIAPWDVRLKETLDKLQANGAHQVTVSFHVEGCKWLCKAQIWLEYLQDIFLHDGKFFRWVFMSGNSPLLDTKGLALTAADIVSVSYRNRVVYERDPKQK